MSARDQLSRMGRAGLANSARWFPALHARGFEAVVVHLGLGIGGEGGEAVDVIKKWHRIGGETMSVPERDDLAVEMVDCLTYLLNLATLLNIDLAAEWDAKQRVCEQRWGTGS